MVAAAAFLSGAVALAAPASGSQWWFLQRGSGLPPAVQKPVVVTQGSWSGHRWSLVAYPSTEKKPLYGGAFYGPSLCWGVTFAGTPRQDRGYMIGGAPIDMKGDDGMRCGSTVGIQTRQKHLPTNPPLDFTGLINETADGYPGWVAGTIPASATHVAILWSALPAEPQTHWLARPRVVVRTQAILAPVAGYRVRVFAIPLPHAISRHTRTAAVPPSFSSITATNQQGRVVARYP